MQQKHIIKSTDTTGKPVYLAETWPGYLFVAEEEKYPAAVEFDSPDEAQEFINGHRSYAVMPPIGKDTTGNAKTITPILR